jgi:pSer/pThr/pTyr-binding forkhead associated (FHA) protein
MAENSEKPNIPARAFLIMQNQVFPLDREIINIGRRLGNQVVIHDPRVSRNHAQLRAAEGQFTLFDLNSTGGTFVNDQKINKSMLYNGDTISLAGVSMIFVKDTPKIIDKSINKTSKLPPLLYEDPPTKLNNGK